MLRYVLRRLALSLVTLLILLIVITLIPNLAPGDPARKIAGAFASPERLQSVTESLGLDDSIPEQFIDLIGDVVTLDFGDSFTRPGQSVFGLVRAALWNSFKLVLFALAITLPISIGAGIWAAYKKDSIADRSIVTVGLALSSIPEFVSGVILQAFLAVPIAFFKVSADPPPGASLATNLNFLLLPALSVLIVYFGYIARITRAGTITSLDADYTRTAFMKGLTTRQVFRRHVLRNALQPTVAVTGTQLGYLFGGLVGLEFVFNYPGLGRLILDAARGADYPVLRGGVVTVALIYMLATLGADLIIAWMNPRARLAQGGEG